jgi:hypothetical protein
MTQADRAEAGDAPRAAQCANCGGWIEDRFCPACGAARRERDSVGDIVREWIQALVRSDRILWSTLGTLIANPGRLTRDWWEGRRAGRMSPVRVLFTVFLFGGLIAWAEHLLIDKAEADIGLLLQVFTYQTVIVITLATALVMPLLLPLSRARSAYEHVTFGLYAGAMFGLTSCAFMLLIVFGGYTPTWLQDIGLLLAPALLPATVAALAGHAVAHLKTAYDVSWLGAIGRVLVLAVCVLVGSLIVTMVLTFTRVNELWMPG